ncbi:hypothetical protein ACJJTC_004920 [Scirpophaga incertulas]
MTLRTPRRRISPRTKQRYRAFKSFVRRALGGAFQPNIELESSTVINLKDLKEKIGNLDDQHSRTEKYTSNYNHLDNRHRKSSYVLLKERNDELISLKEQQAETNSIRYGRKAKILYKNAENYYKNSDDNVDNVERPCIEAHTTHKTKFELMADDNLTRNKLHTQKNVPKKVDARVNEPYLSKHRTPSACSSSISNYSTSSNYSLRHPLASHNLRNHYNCTKPDKFNMAETAINHGGRHKSLKTGQVGTKSKKKQSHEIDDTFITDIIKRQYEPIKRFEKKNSNFSQFSEPVCRDQDFPIHKHHVNESRLCSCCPNKTNKYKSFHGISDGRSVCDTRLYGSEKYMRNRHRKKQRRNTYIDSYNDSDLYDLVPVRDTSPKSRRKITPVKIPPNDYIKVLPPSPRTERPQLNLKPQNYTKFEQYQIQTHAPDISHSHRKYEFPDHMENVPLNFSSARSQYKQNISSSYDTTYSMRSPVYNSQQRNTANESILNKIPDTDVSVDKTDRTLNEIKDILNNFLIEIKNNTTASHTINSHSNATKSREKFSNDYKPCDKSHSQPNVNTAQCNLPLPYLPHTNPCCYPVLPLYPYIPNSYIAPSPSFTCAPCINNHKENTDNKPTDIHDKGDIQTNETEKLIKEIYNFVTNSSRNNGSRFHNKTDCDTLHTNKKKSNCVLSSRGTRENPKLSKNDAKVGTTKIMCNSKSCEAICSKMNSESYYSEPNVNYSDTVLDILSSKPTPTSGSEFSIESIPVKVVRQSKFARVLRSFGLGKKKNNVIEEVSESGSTVEVDAKTKSPYHQKITNYVMHGQDYYNPPPKPTRNVLNRYTNQHDHPKCGANNANCIQGFNGDNYCSPRQYFQSEAAACHLPMPHSSAPPYPNHGDHYNYNQPPVPLCLKEIEVKSTATQSDRKMSFFRKFTMKSQAPVVMDSLNNSGGRNCSTQTAQPSKPLQITKPGKFNWHSLQAKLNEIDKHDDGDFTNKTQKHLADQDVKLKNALLKKLFYKRNPFSPRNLIVRTILGKDKSSFGVPPKIYRPRMFF